MSAERKCSSRWALRVVTLAASMRISTLERVRSCSSNSTVPSNFSNSPRTVATIRWRPVKPIYVCPGSNCQLMFCPLFSDCNSMLLPRMGHVHVKRTPCVSGTYRQQTPFEGSQGENTRECSSHALFLAHVVALSIVADTISLWYTSRYDDRATFKTASCRVAHLS